MINEVNNPLESSLIYIRSRVPQIINDFNASLRYCISSPLFDAIKTIKTDNVSLMKLLQFQKEHDSSVSLDFTNVDLSFLNMMDPFNLIRYVLKYNIFSVFLPYYKRFSEEINQENDYSVFNDDAFLSKIRLPILKNIDISEMSSIGCFNISNEYKVEIPKIGIKSIENYKIFEFMNANYDECNKSKVSEVLVGQIDYKTLALSLVNIYDKIYKKLELNEPEFLQNILVNYEEDHTILDNTNYKGFIILDRILKIDSQVALEEYYSNGDADELIKAKDAFPIIESLKKEIELELDMFTKRVTLSVIFTYLMKVGRDDLDVGPYDIHKDMLNGILDVTLEDINYFNDKFNSNNIDEESETYRYINPLNRKFTGTIFRKRMLDYIMLSFLSNKQSKVNFGGYNFFNVIRNDKNEIVHISTEENPSSTGLNGSIIYKFVLRNLNEIYSNMTYTTNIDKIVKLLNNKKIKTLEAKDVIDKMVNTHLVNTDLKLFITATMDEVHNHYKNSTQIYLYNSNSYITTTVKNHRALASIYKASVHVLFKLMYCLDGIKNYAEYTKTMKVPPEHLERVVKTKTQLKDIHEILDQFKNPYFRGIFDDLDNIPSLKEGFIGTSLLKHVLPSEVYSLALLLNGKMTNTSFVNDRFNNTGEDKLAFDIKKLLILLNSTTIRKKYFMNENIKEFDDSSNFELNAKMYLNSEYKEIYKEFDPDDDMVNTLKNLGDLNDPDLRGTHRALYTSYEDMRKEFLSNENHITELLSNKCLDKISESIEYLNNTDNVSIEDLAFLSTGISLYESLIESHHKDEILSDEEYELLKDKINTFDNYVDYQCKIYLTE